MLSVSKISVSYRQETVCLYASLKKYDFFIFENEINKNDHEQITDDLKKMMSCSKYTLF